MTQPPLLIANRTWNIERVRELPHVSFSSQPLCDQNTQNAAVTPLITDIPPTPTPPHQYWLANALLGQGTITQSTFTLWLCSLWGYEYLSAPALMKCAGILTPGWVDMQIFTLSGVQCNDVCASSVHEYFSICLYLRGTWTLFSQCWVWGEMEERDIKKKQPLKRCHRSSCQFLFAAVHSQQRWVKKKKKRWPALKLSCNKRWSQNAHNSNLGGGGFWCIQVMHREGKRKKIQKCFLEEKIPFEC